MTKKYLLTPMIILFAILLVVNLGFASNGVSSKPDKSGYYTITTSTKLNLSGVTKILLPLSFSKSVVLSKSLTKDGKAISATIVIDKKNLSITPKSNLVSKAKYNLKFSTKSKKYLISLVAVSAPVVTPTPEPTPIVWELAENEEFNAPFNEPDKWIEDTYGDSSPYNVDDFDEDGAYFQSRNPSNFQNYLNNFRSFRKSYTYGKDGWLTVELYGRDSDKDGEPETGGDFINKEGKAELVSSRPYDGAIIRSTKKLPSQYRIEVSVSNIKFGGKTTTEQTQSRWDMWTSQDPELALNGVRINQLDNLPDPWDPGTFSPIENGVYFLCITDYSNPAPHNNIFLHHHRKVVFDTDNNVQEWSFVWDPVNKKGVRDGSRYINMLWLNGDSFGPSNTGNGFMSYTDGGWMYGSTFTDKYLDNETYTFSVERDGKSYTLSTTGTFYYGGKRTYTASRKFTEEPVTWHYNQNPQELESAKYNEIKNYNGKDVNTWPANSSYPDYFFFGDPHINYYAGTADFDDLKLYLPKK